MNMVDYVIIGFVFLGAIGGYRKGLMISLISFLGWVAAGIGAYVLTPRSVIWLNARIGLTASVAGFLREKLPVDAVPAGGTAVFPSALFDLEGLNTYIQNIWVRTPAGSGGLADILSRQGGSILAHSLVFAILFILILFILRFLAHFLSRRLQGTLLGFFNRLGGMVLGAAVNILAAAFVIGVAAPWLVISAGTSTGLLHGLSSSLAESTIAPYFAAVFGWMTALLSGAQI